MNRNFGKWDCLLFLTLSSTAAFAFSLVSEKIFFKKISGGKKPPETRTSQAVLAWDSYILYKVVRNGLIDRQARSADKPPVPPA